MGEKQGMMKIGVISDTHLTQPTQDLEELMNGPFKDVEMILHAGDITELAVLDAFAGKKILAVCGNMDSSRLGSISPLGGSWKRKIQNWPDSRMGRAAGDRRKNCPGVRRN